MKIGFLCDSHVGGGEKSPQYAYLCKAVEQMKKDGIDTVVCLGDITAFGESAVFDRCVSLLGKFNNAFVLLGNADVRKKEDKDIILSKAKEVFFREGKKNFLGLHLIAGRIKEEDFAKIENLCSGDVLMMHYGVHSLIVEHRERLEEILKGKKLNVIHAHSHKRFDYYIGESRVFGLRALDPDKSIGDYPCITYFDTETEEYTEKVFAENKKLLEEIASHFGISCADNIRELHCAIDNKISAVELRMSTIKEDEAEIYSLINEWRDETQGYLSAHMPNIKYDGEEVAGIEDWLIAIERSLKYRVDGITVHPPRIKKSILYSNNELLEQLIDLYATSFARFEGSVKIGIENVHKTKAEAEAGLPNEELGFGYTPDDVLFFVNKLNEKLGKNRVGVVLDVGHTKNNGSLSSIYTVGSWYEMVGDKTVAYHIHQVLSTENGMKNHNAIENWFGPLISYSSFFYSWDKGIINRAPVFLEVRGSENYLKSVNAFNELL